MSPTSISPLIEQAWRLEAFVPPFAFSAFFSPEDTLLCACAADSALELVTPKEMPPSPLRFAELTSGSGLVGLYLLGKAPRATLLGLDIDPEAASVSERNARVLGYADRARFAQADLWADATSELLTRDRPDLLVCNPPYVPEPPGTTMQIEAGAGPQGTAHLMRALQLAQIVEPRALALSWCSLAEPGKIVSAAESSGYELDTLFVTAIADGEYSGSVHDYLRGLADCFISEDPNTVDAVAPDGSARFAYLLLAASFRPRAVGGKRGDDYTGSPHSISGVSMPTTRSGKSASATVQTLCEDFAARGIGSLVEAQSGSHPFNLHTSILNRWDELRLRVMLHGEVVQSTVNSA